MPQSKRLISQGRSPQKYQYLMRTWCLSQKQRKSSLYWNKIQYITKFLHQLLVPLYMDISLRKPRNSNKKPKLKNIKI